MFSPIQKDVLIELLNIHIGQAASVLSEMLNQRVILTIPEIELITSDNLNILEFVQLGFSIGQKIISSIKFESKFEGMAYLVFPIEKAKSLVEICLEKVTTEKLDDSSITLTDLDFDVLKELCNIVFNSLIGEFGNLLNLKIRYSVPDINILCISTNKNYSLPPEINILILHTKFLLINNEIAATILVTLSTNSIYLLINKINELLGDLL